MTRHRYIVRSKSELGDQMPADTQRIHAPQRGRGDQNVADAHDSAVAPLSTLPAKQVKPASLSDHLDIDDAGGYALTPRRKQPIAQPLAPGYLWNSTTQELIPILSEDHPDYRQNQETIIEAHRRWNKGTNKSG